MNTPGQAWRSWIQIFLGLSLTLLFFYMMAPFIVAIFLGAVIAILCYPAFSALTRRLPRHLASLVCTLGVTLGILLPIAFVLYSGAFRVLELVRKIKMPSGGDSFSFQLWLQHPTIVKAMSTISVFLPTDREWLQGQGEQLLQSVAEKLSVGVANFFASVPGLILAFFVVILSLYFFLVDGAKFTRFLSLLSPLKPDRTHELYSAFEKSCRGVVLGVFAGGVLQGLLMGITFAVVGLPNAFLVGVVTVVLGMVPVVGSAPLWIGASIYLFLKAGIGLAVVMLVAGFFISASDNIVRPVILRGQSEMHPLLALVSVFGAVNLMGATGIFLGPIIAAVFVSFLKIISLEIKREEAGHTLASGEETCSPGSPAL